MVLTMPSFYVTALFVAISFHAYVAAKIVYNIWLHPLRRFPGPLHMRATRLGWAYSMVRGTLPYDIFKLHQQYGDIVRIAPNELAFVTQSSFQDIQGHRTKGLPEFSKPNWFYTPVPGRATDIISADRDEHSMLRRTLAHGFSDKGLREQQPLVTHYIDLLVQRLHEHCKDGQAELDMCAWYNYTTFDVIGDLAFGEPFGCLKNSAAHPWVDFIFEMGRPAVVVQALASTFPTVLAFLFACVPSSMLASSIAPENLAAVKLKQRMAAGKERPDLVSGLIKRKEEWGITDAKMATNASVLIIAGSETTASLLAGVTYYLMKDPAVMQKVTDEVRTVFKSDDEINFNSVNDLTYMLACLNEALRCYPPVAAGLPREVPKGGATVSGEFLPEDTIVSIGHWAMYHQERYFKKAFEFRPERFLGDKEFADDVKEVLQPFNVGPRNCIGRNLAYVEMRTILARILYNFDLKISERSDRWLNQKNFNLWEKPPLYAFLTPRQKA